jgi:protein tyrosine phosphatase (PTP) superfamily phosphohydrolase (DUF442 family)
MSRALSSIYNYLPLTDTLVTAGQPTREQLSAIADAGFEVVINLALPTSDNAILEEGDIVYALGMHYVHIPVIWEQPTLADFERFCDAMEDCARERVFVHCAANMRVSVFVALYRIRRLGWGRDAALAAVREVWEPDAVWSDFIERVLASG